MGKLLKAVTFSYDDGVESDIRLLEIFNKYNIRATFNLNSGVMTPESTWVEKEFEIHRMKPEGMKALYAGHEIAAHGSEHKHITELENEADLKAEFFDDIVALEDVFDKRIQGAAYAFGEYNDGVCEYLKRIGLNYSRTTESNHSFELQSDLLRFKPTCHHSDEKIFELCKEFLEMKPETPQIFYIWGHSYEYDRDRDWERIEEICKLLSNREDIFYGTNTEVFEYYNLY